METCQHCGLLISHNGDGVWRDGDGNNDVVTETGYDHTHSPEVE